MFLIKALSPFTGDLESVIQGKQRRLRKSFFAAQVLSRSSLSTGALDVRTLRFKMEEEPELDAGVRDCQTDPLLSGKLDGLFEARMLVNIEDAPDLIVGAAATSALGPLVGRLGSSGSLNKRHWRSAKIVNLNIDTAAVATVPVSQVLLLGHTTLNKNKKLSTAWSRFEWAARRRH